MTFNLSLRIEGSKHGMDDGSYPISKVSQRSIPYQLKPRLIFYGEQIKSITVLCSEEVELEVWKAINQAINEVCNQNGLHVQRSVADQNSDGITHCLTCLIQPITTEMEIVQVPAYI